MNTSIFHHNDLKNFAELLLKNGYKVYAVPPDDRSSSRTWLYFEKDGRIAYAQADYAASVHLSSVHKPSREHGTGFRMTELSIIPTLEDAEAALNCVAPTWCNRIKRTIQKYSSFAEYQKMEQVLRYEEVTL